MEVPDFAKRRAECSYQSSFLGKVRKRAKNQKGTEKGISRLGREGDMTVRKDSFERIDRN